MRPRTGRYLRPLLGVRRATTEAACAALGLEPWHDPHNDDRSLQRVRLRQEVLPLLEDVLQGGVADALARTAALLQDDLDALDGLSDVIMHGALPWQGTVHDHDEGGTGLAVAALAELPRALRTRVLRAWLLGHGAAEVTSVHTAALDALVTGWHGQGPLDLPGGLRVSRTSGRLVVAPPHPQE